MGAAALIKQLDTIADARDPGQLTHLGQVLAALDPVSCGPAEFRALLGVLERFPLDDGFESFWSILHFLEGCEGYEPHLVESVLRQPAELTLIMLNRLWNAGFTESQGTSYSSILEDVAADTAIDSRLRGLARQFLKHQEGGDA